MQSLEKIKKELEQRQEFLKGRVAECEEELRASHSQNFSEQAVEREKEEVTENLENAYLQEIAQIDRALVRFEKGEYGSCVSCGEEIPQARLEILPYTSFCITCEREKEKRA
ncbi:TraR/DksA family transcriptional regulator [Sneathiella chinensis]|uniref:DksA C4-type domain-containing protein n=1 Tax=Sneathiella chinensis TaxID=349750 RepID=A0ABQ5U3V6_9PROT|nr:TraR/DksA family transcriptional regulator [Sneathiella chinensis]GLQ05964.1 hypothetical protein GCM10007924_11850 [Sneathiella chinensis]